MPARRLPVAAGASCGLAMLLWLSGLYGFAGMIPTAPTATAAAIGDDRLTDAIVVLTGGSGRLEAGVRLLGAGRAERLFVSGVYDGVDVRYLLETVLHGSERLAHRVEIGNATNTTGNAEETAAWIAYRGYTSLRLVTAAYHMPRSLLEFSAVLDGVEVVPHPVFPDHVKADWWRWPGSAVLVIKEYNKYLLAWLRRTLTRLW